MLWNGNVLGTIEDFTEAVVALDEQDAEKFRAIFSHAFPEYTEVLLGYIVRGCNEQEKVLDLLNLDGSVLMLGYIKGDDHKLDQLIASIHR